MSVSAEGAEKYFDEALKKSDYYAKDLGVWGGKGADRLGLKGEVTRVEYAGGRKVVRPFRGIQGGEGGEQVAIISLCKQSTKRQNN